MEFLGLFLALFLTIIYLLKCDECAKLRKRLKHRDFDYVAINTAKAINEFIEETLSLNELRYKPEPIKNLTWSHDMKIGVVKLSWIKSVSPDVVSQELLIKQGEEEPVVVELAASIVEYKTNVPEDTVVHVELLAYDGTFRSDVTTLDFEVGDLVKPEAPAALLYEIIDVIDSDAPEDPDVPELPVEPA